MARRNNTLGLKMAELSLAAPQVVAHRLARFAAAGASPGAGDRREMHRMGAEKVAAFWESWAAMAMQSFAAQQRAALAFQASLWRAAWSLPTSRGAQSLVNGALGAQQRAALDVLAHGLAPVHRRAVANAKRLGRVKR